MRHTREQLIEDAAKARAWQQSARAAGRDADADALLRLEDTALRCAERFATFEPLVAEQEDAAVRIRSGRFFTGCAEASAPAGLPVAACPWSKEGICKGCPWTRLVWIFGGRHYECLTAYIVRNYNR